MVASYRDFAFPLNAFVHVLTLEGLHVEALHYGVFDSPSEPFPLAQDRSTALVLQRLPPPPARLLDVGLGLGALLARVTRLGYEAEGIGPDAAQIAIARARHGDRLAISCTSFEAFAPADRRFDVVVFQESSQYIDAAVLFANAGRLTDRVLVLDEFAMRPLSPATLHSFAGFLAAATAAGFRLVEDVDLSLKAAPTVDWFMARLPRHRDALVRDLGLSTDAVQHLIDNGPVYQELYRTGAYGYRLLDFRRRSR